MGLLVKKPFLASANLASVGGRTPMFNAQFFERHAGFVIFGNGKDLSDAKLCVGASFPFLTISSVSAAFSERYPSAIRRAVALIIVNAVNAKIFCISVCKRPLHKWHEVSPFSAKANTLGSVPLKIFSFTPFASIFHSIPDLIKSGVGHSMFRRSSHFESPKCSQKTYNQCTQMSNAKET